MADVPWAAEDFVSEVAPALFIAWGWEAGRPRLHGVIPWVGQSLTLLTPADRLALDAQLTARDPGRARWHVSPVPEAPVPTVVAWYGIPDDPHPTLLRADVARPAHWVGGSVDAAAAAAQTALAGLGIPVHFRPTPPVLAAQFAETLALS